jgi:hypothetical protein
MNFTAHGYAELTSLLKADIAVLEGGYSIEGALPYINTGIILAMAGMDYSQLQEPDYEPERFQQSAETTNWIEQTAEKVLDTWQNRGRLAEQQRARNESHRRTRQIFYDTDNIYETQYETIRICDDCAGALRIESSSDRKIDILGVHIPIDACPQCLEQAHQWYETADGDRFDHMFLQDRTEDLYHQRPRPASPKMY